MERYRFHAEAAIYFVTFSVVEWLPVFVSEPACRIIADSLNFCHRTKGLRTNAYVIMPSHLHAVVFHESFDGKILESVLTDMRKFTGRRLADFCQSHLPACFGQVLRQAAGDDRDRRFWQPTRHAEYIESEDFWQRKVDYLHENPCRKGLVFRPEHWRFSSADYWLSANPPALGAPALGAPALGAPALGAPALGAGLPARPHLENDVKLSTIEW